MFRTSFFFISILIGLSLQAQIQYDNFFLSKTMRFDYNIAGDANGQVVYFEQLREEPYWGGSSTNLVDRFDFGDYRVLIYDVASDQLIYSRGYSDLFFEWQATEEAKSIKRTFYSSVIFPYPRNEIRLELDRRKRNMEWEKIHEQIIQPDSYHVNNDDPPHYKTHKIYNSGAPDQKVDIVILPDGYTKRQMKKFKRDSKRFVGYFFDCAPFDRYADRFNFWMVMAPSEQKGTDIPGKDIWKCTVLNTHFYTFDSERYLTTRDVKSIRDMAGCVPYDQIYILVNTSKYGGGGIYNFYNLCSSNDRQSDKVFTHEFGHAFAALADEYAYEDTPPDQLYDLSVEPFQVNITTLVDFDSKWADMVGAGTPVPTKVSEETKDKIGAFEGAAYVQRKVYRPMYDCKMRSNNTPDFCPVCEKALIEMIEFYSN